LKEAAAEAAAKSIVRTLIALSPAAALIYVNTACFVDQQCTLGHWSPTTFLHPTSWLRWPDRR
jgi:hypothetical protein